jgi:hypothetical protein
LASIYSAPSAYIFGDISVGKWKTVADISVRKWNLPPHTYMPGHI